MFVFLTISILPESAAFWPGGAGNVGSELRGRALSALIDS